MGVMKITPIFFGENMSNFPDIEKPSSRSRTVSKPQLKSEFEAGYTQIRPKATRAKYKWTLSWEYMSLANWELLKAHFIENSGGSFIITGDMIFEDSDYTVIYSIDEIQAQSTGVKGQYSVEIQIEVL